MFGFWGYLLWLVIDIKLTIYTVWLWKQGFRLGAAGVVFLMLGTLTILILGSVFGSGLG